MVRGTTSLDFTARVSARLPALLARLESRDAVINAVRDANASLDPQKVAVWLVLQAEEWMSAPCWAVVAPDAAGQLAVLAATGGSPAITQSVVATAGWVMSHDTAFMAADLANDGRIPEGGVQGTALAFPLLCRYRTAAVLVGLDPLPSTAAPALGDAVTAALAAVLEPAAIALENALSLRKAEALSVIDDLTGLSNSRYLNLILRRESKRSVRSGRPLSVLFIDMDGFKSINTAHGHMAGSRALVEAAAVIRGCARETDVVARFGGDEFAVILVDTGRAGAVSVAERIRDRLREHGFLASEGLDIALTASIGIATLPDVTGSAEELLKAADRAMYKVKDAGKDGIHVAEEEELDEPKVRD